MTRLSPQLHLKRSKKEDNWFFKLPAKERHTFYRGWDAYFDRDSEGPSIKWLDAHEDVEKNPRPCKLCRKFNLEINDKSYDACLGILPNVLNACCGHGSVEGYIQYVDGKIERLPILCSRGRKDRRFPAKEDGATLM